MLVIFFISWAGLRGWVGHGVRGFEQTRVVKFDSIIKRDKLGMSYCHGPLSFFIPTRPEHFCDLCWRSRNALTKLGLWGRGKTG